MNLTRIVVLGTLDAHGPQHGHQIRRRAEITNVPVWGGVSVGALYRELRVMEAEGLVAAIRTEQVGRRPARTVYEITADGRLELALQREQAFRSFQTGPDALGVALLFAGLGDQEEFTEIMRGRQAQIEITAAELAAKRRRLEEGGYLDSVQATVLRRAEIYLRAELDWHREFEAILTDVLRSPESALPDPSNTAE